MYRRYTSKEFWELYETLPDNLQKMLLDEGVGGNVEKICKRYDIENKYFDILNLVTQTLLGLLPVEEFKKILIRDVGLSISISEKVSQEIVRFIFFPVKKELVELYGAESPSEEILKKESAAIPKKDSYREPIE